MTTDTPTPDQVPHHLSPDRKATRRLMGQHLFIEHVDAAQYIEGVYTINNAQLGMTKSGKPFLKAIISDRTGRLTARMWNISEQVFDALPTDGFVWIEGNTQPYQGEIQLIIQNIEQVDIRESDLINLIPSSNRNIDEMFQELLRLLDTLEHPGMRALATTYLEDERIMDRFRIAPAAVNMHHAWLGGLLEHTLQLCNLADRMLPLYPALNRDIVLMSLFLHDLCKCYELRWDAAFAYTEQGQLLGHLVMGAMLLNDKARQARKRQLDFLRTHVAEDPSADAAGESTSQSTDEGTATSTANRPIRLLGEPIQARSEADILPSRAVLVMQHIIVSHHGEPEHGAAKLPATPEAIFVAHLDNLDAKTQMSIDISRRESGQDELAGGGFSEKVWAIGTRLFRPDPLDGYGTRNEADDSDNGEDDRAAKASSPGSGRAQQNHPFTEQDLRRAMPENEASNAGST